MRRDEILSTIASYPVDRLIYSSFGFYGRRRGGELPGVWFAEALSHVGAASPTVRKALLRMEKADVLQARKTGRHKIYSPSPYSQASIDAGAEKLMAPSDQEWSGEWTLVHARFDGDRRLDREQVRTVLRSEGFAPLGPGVYIHPRVRADRLLNALRARELSRFVTVIRGRVEGQDPAELAAEAWDLEALARGYRQLIDRYEPLLAGDFDTRWSGAAGFALKFAVVLDYLEVAWNDPDLPRHVLPPRWPGYRTRRLVGALNARLLPLAVAFSDAVMQRVLEASPDLELPAVQSITSTADARTP